MESEFHFTHPDLGDLYVALAIRPLTVLMIFLAFLSIISLLLRKGNRDRLPVSSKSHLCLAAFALYLKHAP